MWKQAFAATARLASSRWRFSVSTAVGSELRRSVEEHFREVSNITPPSVTSCPLLCPHKGPVSSLTSRSCMNFRRRSWYRPRRTLSWRGRWTGARGRCSGGRTGRKRSAYRSDAAPLPSRLVVEVMRMRSIEAMTSSASSSFMWMCRGPGGATHSFFSVGFIRMPSESILCASSLSKPLICLRAASSCKLITVLFVVFLCFPDLMKVCLRFPFAFSISGKMLVKSCDLGVIRLP